MFASQEITQLPYPLTKIAGRPSPQAKNAMHLYVFLFQYGCLKLLMSQQEYRRVTSAQQDFPEPTRPNAPDVDNLGTAVLVARAESTYKRDMERYQAYSTAEALLKAGVMACVDVEYYSTLENPNLGFHNVTTLQLITHLKNTYGKISAEQLIENVSRIQTPWHPSQSSIESLWKQHDDGRAFTISCPRGEVTEANLIVYAMANIRNTGILSLKEAVLKFDKLPAAQQTWTEFKDRITEAYNQLSDQDKAISTNQLGYSGANNMQEKEHFDLFPWYCWTHGLTWNEKHTSLTSLRPDPQHNPKATLQNMCGSCTKIQRRKGDVGIWRPKPRNNNNGADGSGS